MKKSYSILVATLMLLIPPLVPSARAQSAASDYTTGYRYDAFQRVTGIISPDPDGSGPLHYLAVRNTYDGSGRLVAVETGELATWQPDTTVSGTPLAPSAWTGFTVSKVTTIGYDAMDRKIKETVASGPAGATVYQVTQYSYDAMGRLLCTAVRMDPSQWGTQNDACVPQLNGSNGPDRITRNVYDSAGQLIQVRKAVGTSFEQAYATYDYTPNGKQKTVIDANGNRATLTYDGFDRQSGWYFPSPALPSAFNPTTQATALASAGSASTTDYEAYGYDANGNRTSLRKRDARTIIYAYDALNRVVSKTFPNGGARAVYYNYDLRGLQTAARFDSTSGADAVTSSWDGVGRQTSSTTSMSGISRALTYAYDANGNRTRVTYPDGQYVNYYRDGLDRLHYTDLNTSAPLFYPPYDAAGRVSALYRWSSASGAWGPATGFAYDGISRLSSYWYSLNSSSYNATTTFGYNPASQITSRTRDNDAYAFTGYVNVNRGYARNGLNQYTSAGPATFGYDPNGNLTSDGTNVYSYDIENRLVSSSNGTSLSYDPLGRLYQVARNGSATQFLYDGDALVAEYDGAGTMLKRYVHSDGDDDPLVQYDGASTASPRFLYADQQGSIVAITDASGNVTNVNSYDEYGIPATGNSGRFQYTGQAWLPELGMYHYKARIYSPTLGRFLQTDPVGYDDQINFYAYVGNDPVNGTDPSGTLAIKCHFNGDTNKGSCTSSDDGDNKNINVSLTYSKTVNGSVQTKTSNNSYSIRSIVYSQAYGAGITSVIKAQAQGAFGINVQFTSKLYVQSTPVAALPSIWSPGAQGAAQNAYDHWKKHGSEFPNIQNAKEYAEAAKEFVNNPPPGTLTKTRSNGDTLFYNPATNTFAVRSPSGAPRTMFKPQDGMNYWNRQ